MRDIPFMLMKLREGTTAPESQPSVAAAFEVQLARIAKLEAALHQIAHGPLSVSCSTSKIEIPDAVFVQIIDKMQRIAREGLERAP